MSLAIAFAIPSDDIFLARLMFWGECGVKHKSIEQAPIEEPRKHKSIVSDLDNCATAIVIDSSSTLQLINIYQPFELIIKSITHVD